MAAIDWKPKKERNKIMAAPPATAFEPGSYLPIGVGQKLVDTRNQVTGALNTAGQQAMQGLESMAMPPAMLYDTAVRVPNRLLGTQFDENAGKNLVRNLFHSSQAPPAPIQMLPSHKPVVPGSPIPTNAAPAPIVGGSGYRRITSPDGSIILTNREGDQNVIDQVNSDRQRNVAAAVNVGGQMQEVFSNKNGTAPSAISSRIYDLVRNRHTGQAVHGDAMGGDQGGNVDTVRHLRNMLMADQPAVLTPGPHVPETQRLTLPGGRMDIWGQPGLQASQPAGTPRAETGTQPAPIPALPGAMPATAVAPAIEMQNMGGTYAPSPIAPSLADRFRPAPVANPNAPAMGFVAANGQETQVVPPQTLGGIGGAQVSEQGLQDLGAFMAQRQAERSAAIPGLPTNGPINVDQALARGYGLAGDANGWAGALVRNAQAHGYARSVMEAQQQNETNNRKNIQSQIDQLNAALGVQKTDALLADTQSQIEARGSENAARQANTEAQKVQTQINQLTLKGLSEMQPKDVAALMRGVQPANYRVKAAEIAQKILEKELPIDLSELTPEEKAAFDQRRIDLETQLLEFMQQDSAS